MFQHLPRRRGALAPLRGALLCVVLMFLSACSTTRSLHSDVDPRLWQQRQEKLTELEVWSFNGRVAVRAEDHDGWNASLNWQQEGERYEIQLVGAFGQGGARLHGDARHAVMTMADQAPQMASSVETLMQAQLGWYVPVKGLRYWLTGRPGPGFIDLREVDQFGRLLRLQQDGWQVVFRRYMPVDDVLELPRKLELNNPHLRVRLVIDQWRLGEEAQG